MSDVACSNKDWKISKRPCVQQSPSEPAAVAQRASSSRPASQHQSPSELTLLAQREITYDHLFKDANQRQRSQFWRGKPSQSSRTTVWRCDFTAGAHGGRLGHVEASLFSSLGLLLLPSTMFVSLRFFHGNGEPNSSC
ncbi:hypothetical protein LR48_Vigan503s001400 [Vigna angularis]|uniref:Uncharacterized protein n=1 Tax=Phaseolus angularis TaxID=3914 RepID=A0A0L9TD89_PHAAN|nr:hypothetical protein LR48_Vigan503s001400 [Vigna angularis]